MATPSLQRLIADYLAHLAVERALAHNTLQAYTRDLRRYERFCEGRNLAVDYIDGHTLSEFTQALARGSRDESALSAASVNRIVSAVRGFHKFLVAENVTPHDPTADLKPPAAPRPLPKALPVNEVLSILAAPNNDEPMGTRDRALLELLYGSGCRISEAVSLDIDDLDLVAGIVLLRGKGGKSRLVPLGKHSRAAIEAYLVRCRPGLAMKGAAGPALFLNSLGRRLSRQSGWGILQQAATAAGVKGHVSPHVLRHSFATHLLDGGADIRVVQELLGHSSVTTTQIYTLVTVDKLREVYVSTHPRALG